MWVATNRQKPPEENAFAQRARMKRGETEPEKVSEPLVDLAALRQAAEEAAALVHAETRPLPDPVGPPPYPPRPQGPSVPTAVPVERHPESGQFVQAPDISTYAKPSGTEEPRRGRPKSKATEERDAKALEYVRAAGAEGITKPVLAEKMEEKEQQVYTSLRQLQKDGKVKNERLDVGWRWIAV